MPHDIQEKMVHSLPGLEHAKILRYGYAIEYDAIYPTQLKNTLETLDTAFDFATDDLAVRNLSELRDLTTSVSGGYTYRYEFDVTFGYNEVMIIQKEVGKDVNLQIERKE